MATAVVLPAAASAQARFNPNAPIVPAWSHTVKLPAPDGRTFVTDGRLTIDLQLGRPAVRPSATLALIAPSGVPVSSYYVAFLRKNAPRVRFRMRAAARARRRLTARAPL